MAWPRRARAAARSEPSAIVAEGYMDVIALHRAGFATAVAPLGTALTETQIEELWRLAPEPVLCFDGDAAGQRAAARALERALPLLEARPLLRFATAGGRGSRHADPPAGRPRGDARCSTSARPWPRCCGRSRPAPSPSTRRSAAPRWSSGLSEQVRRIADRACRSITATSSASDWPSARRRRVRGRREPRASRPWPDRDGRLRAGAAAAIARAAPASDGAELRVLHRSAATSGVRGCLRSAQPSVLLDEVDEDLPRLNFLTRDLDRLCIAKF